MRRCCKTCTRKITAIFALGLLLVTTSGCGEKLADLPGQIADGEFSIDTEELGDMLWNEEWNTYDVSSVTIFDDDYPTVKDEDYYEDTFTAAGITTLNLELGGCEVKVEVSPDADFHVTAENVSAFQAFTKDNTLYVKGVHTGTWTGGLNTNMKVMLQVPGEVTYEQVKLLFGAGDFEIQGLNATSVNAEVGAGRLQVSGLWTDELNAELGAGQITIEEAQVRVNANFEVGAGDFSFMGSIPGDLQAECAMGNMEIRILGSTQADHNFTMECVAGNLTVGNETAEGLAEKEIDNNSASDYELECAMGNLTILFE